MNKFRIFVIVLYKDFREIVFVTRITDIVKKINKINSTIEMEIII